jgi:cob(I)alamin adenosyltransferase
LNPVVTYDFVETAIDRLEQTLPPLKGFILPGGHGSAALAHVARTVCRRAERRVVQIAYGDDERRDPGNLKNVLVYLNRLSDYFFILARYCNRITGKTEILCQG